MTWTHCEVYWDLDFEPVENEWQAASGIGGLRCLASIFGIRLIIFVFGDFCVFKEIFSGNASHPVVAFVSVVAFCGLLWSFVTSRCFCMMVCGAKCHFYGHCRILWYL